MLSAIAALPSELLPILRRTAQEVKRAERTRPLASYVARLGAAGGAYPGSMDRIRPLIAVPAYRLEPGRVARWPEGGYGVPAPYLEALSRAGARTAILWPGEVADPDELLAPFDGLLLVGGGDIDPARYGAVLGAHDYAVDPERDAFEIELLRAAERAAAPTLCICRGAQ